MQLDKVAVMLIFAFALTSVFTFLRGSLFTLVRQQCTLKQPINTSKQPINTSLHPGASTVYSYTSTGALSSIIIYVYLFEHNCPIRRPLSGRLYTVLYTVLYMCTRV
jgi:hypothetical protein